MAYVMRFAGVEDDAGAIDLGELRRELFREAQARLEDFEAAPTRERRGRVLQALEAVAVLVRSERLPDEPACVDG
jgi:hypothetical protein